MNRPKIKICGITNEEDALKLARYDLFALGFIIEKNIPSGIELSLATRIIRKLPSHILSVVGVAGLDPGEIIEVCKRTRANVVQIQRGSTISEILEIKRELPRLKIWRAVFTNQEPDLKQISNLEKVVDAILIHSKEVEWPVGLRIAKVLKKPFILAGGLNLKNVKRAIEEFHPFAVDLIRGMETISGKKDFNKVEKLIQIVRASNIGPNSCL
jgi:phosphoribosylanthranilate isomerase